MTNFSKVLFTLSNERANEQTKKKLALSLFLSPCTRLSSSPPQRALSQEPAQFFCAFKTG